MYSVELGSLSRVRPKLISQDRYFLSMNEISNYLSLRYTDFFVKSPFVFEGIIIGLIGAIIPLVILFFVYRSAISYIVNQFNTISDAFSMMPIAQVFTILVPVALILGAGIGLIGSIIATNKYIKV